MRGEAVSDGEGGKRNGAERVGLCTVEAGSGAASGVTGAPG